MGISNAGEAAVTSVTLPQDYQGLTIWLGDGAPCQIDDAARAVDVADWISAPVQRATVIARLRAVADMLEQAQFRDSLGIESAVASTPNAIR